MAGKLCRTLGMLILLVFPTAVSLSAPDAVSVVTADYEQKVMDYLNAMLAEQGRMQNVPRVDGRFLREMAQVSGAKRVLEVGTSNGYSAIWIGLGLKATGGRLTTIEIDDYRYRLAVKNFSEVGMDGMIEPILGDAFDVIPDLSTGFDMVFIDLGAGDLTGKAFDLVLPKVRTGGIILCHAVRMDRAGMKSFVERIESDPALDTFVIPMSRPGISLSIIRRRSAD